MVILTNPEGNELQPLSFTKFDVDLNGTRDFELRMPAGEYTDRIQDKGRVFVPNTEFGGIIGGKKTQTSTNEIILTGRSWRGMLSKKIIKPPEGAAYKTITGELNSCLETLIDEQGLSELFVVSDNVAEGAVSSFQFDRYIDLLSGVEKMLKSAGHRLEIKYVQQERGAPGVVSLEAVKIEDLSQRTELSQDSRLDFIFSETKNGVNHLVCLGQGELTDRLVVDLYVAPDGSIGSTQHYFGQDEVAEVYENTGASDIETLTEDGRNKLMELKNNSSFSMSGASFEIEADIGDIIGGRDYITGMYAATPIRNKIYTSESGEDKIEYSLEENEKSSSVPSNGGGSSSGGTSIVVDAELSETSTNPVQNKAVAQKFKQLETNAENSFDALQRYTDQKIADLINGAPSTLDTLKEIADAFEENKEVIEALEAAIGSKAQASDLNDHINNKENPHEVGLDDLGVSASAAELNFMTGVTANVQSQLNGKAADSNFVKSGSGAKAGLVPAPSTTAGTTKYLREDGTWTVPPDNNTTYGEATQSAAGLQSAGDKLKEDFTNIGYGTCATAAATAAKVITISGNTEWALKAGSIIIVKFSATNTAQNPTFNVNGTGAKRVWYNTALITTGSLGYAGTANRPMMFAYDGTQYIFMGWAIDANTTYSNASLGQGYGTCATAAATAAKVVTLSSYALVTGGIVAVKFTYAVPSSATMNINSKGAKPIYYRGAAITAGTIGAGDVATFIYNGSQYILLAVDRSQEDIDGIITDETITAFADAGLPIT